MLSETLFRVPREPGLHVLQRRGDRGARELTSSRLCLRPGTSATYVRPGEETIVVLQQGRGTFSTPELTKSVSRTGVFTERATAMCVPPGVSLTVTADTDLEAVLVSAPSADAGPVALIGPNDVTVNPRGRGTYAREVHDLFVRDPYAQAADGRRNVQPARALEQLSAAQARRQERRAVPRRGVSLQGQPRARLRAPDALHRGW